MRQFLHAAFALLVLLLAACGGGSGSAPPPVTSQPGAHVLLDTTAGSESFVQAQLVAVVLRAADGTLTPNLLAAPRLLTCADPTGAPETILLTGLPSGTFGELHLLLAPGSVVRMQPDGARTALDLTTATVTVPVSPPLQHQAGGTSWLHARHRSTPALATAGNRTTWTPDLVGQPAAGVDVAATLAVASVHGTTLTASLGGAALRVEVPAGAVLLAADGALIGDPATFLSRLGGDDDLHVRGALHDHGLLRARHVQQRRRGDGPRLLGRVLEVLPAATSLRLLALAEDRADGRALLAPPIEFLVRASQARIHRSGDPTLLPFSALLAGDLLKVEWTQRTGNEVTAREIELEHRDGQPAQPEIEGAVAAVDVPQGTIRVVPRGNDPLLVGGRSVTTLTVRLATGADVLRQAPSGGERRTIGLADVVPGQDRIWLRGALQPDGALLARVVRVRDDR